MYDPFDIKLQNCKAVQQLLTKERCHGINISIDDDAFVAVVNILFHQRSPVIATL
jgi:hypothetical protein